jgi:ABC-type antimicrobial peptide transport system permease subunit
LITTAGAIVGVPAALVVGRVLQNTFVRTDPYDVGVLVVTTVLLAVVALVASLVPASRAARIEPAVALRSE